MGGGGDDFENNPISWQGGTRISSPSQYPVSNIEWTKLKKKKRKKKGEKKGERLKSKRDTCVSRIQREGEISISNRQQHAEGKLDLRPLTMCRVRSKARNRLRQSDGGRCCWPRCFSRRISRPGGRRNQAQKGADARCLTPNPASHLSNILRLLDFLGY